MIKGCNRRVIVMRETGNDMIEEAIFVLKTVNEKGGLSENDIIRHASRILEESAARDRLSQLSMNVSGPCRRFRVSSFLSGAVLGALVAVGVVFIL